MKISNITNTSFGKFNLSPETLERISKDTGMTPKELTHTLLKDFPKKCHKKPLFTDDFHTKREIPPRNIYLYLGRKQSLEEVKARLNNIDKTFFEIIKDKFNKIKMLIF